MEFPPSQKKIFVFLVVAFVIASALIAIFVLFPQITKKQPTPSEQGEARTPLTQEEIDAKLKELAAPAS